MNRAIIIRLFHGSTGSKRRNSSLDAVTNRGNFLVAFCWYTSQASCDELRRFEPVLPWNNLIIIARFIAFLN